jgi:oxalate decarboxylase
VFLETFASEEFMDVSLNQLRRVSSEMLKAYLNIDKAAAIKSRRRSSKSSKVAPSPE